MDSAIFLLFGLLVSIALHAQAVKGNSELERIPPPPVLGDKSKAKRKGLDPLKIRADAMDKLLEAMEHATARWRDLEATYSEFRTGDSALSDFTAFLDAETGEGGGLHAVRLKHAGHQNIFDKFVRLKCRAVFIPEFMVPLYHLGISANDILPAEVKAIQKLYQGAVKEIEITSDYEELFANEINLHGHWRRLTQIKEFQIPECIDFNNAVLLNAFNMEIIFADLGIIARVYISVFERFLNKVYQEWLTCIMSEIAEFQQDPDFSGFECEASVAAEMKQINFHYSLVIVKLEAAGVEFDDTLAIFKTAIEGVGAECYDTGRLLEAIDALSSVGVGRRENEVAIFAQNKAYFDAFQRWLDFFTANKRGVDNNKAELNGLLKKLLEKKSRKNIGEFQRRSTK